MARSRTTKTIAKRIDLGYFKRSHPLRWWRRVLTWGAGLLAVVGIAIPSLQFSQGKPQFVDVIHNPGPVSKAHAMFENDCAKCHRAKETGGYWLSTSDDLCMQCHQAAIHHANAVQAAEGDIVSYERRVLALKDPSDPDNPAKGRSAGCATCHIEHRGNELLAATSDAHCIVCHQNLTGTMIDESKQKTTSTVLAFDAGQHPGFGRSFRQSDGSWHDPTVLAFNHQFHMEKVKSAADACAVCHTTANPPTTQSVDGRTLPTLSAEKDPVGRWQNADPRGYMQPISFARHCSACHALELPESLNKTRVGRNDLNFAQIVRTAKLPHSDMNLIRNQIELELSKTMNVGTAGFTRKGRTGSAQTMQEGEWIAENLKYIATKVNDEVLSKLAEQIPKGERPQHNLKYKDARLEVPDPSAAASQPAMNRQTLANYYTAWVAFSVCARCHGIDGDLPKLDGSSPGQLLATVPTGIPSEPRHRFAAARFSHDDHRTLDFGRDAQHKFENACLACHLGIESSTLTSHVVLPNINTAAQGAKTCADCHHADNATRGAPAACVTCHAFHDRTYEKAIAVKLPAPASQPAP